MSELDSIFSRNSPINASVLKNFTAICVRTKIPVFQIHANELQTGLIHLEIMNMNKQARVNEMETISLVFVMRRIVCFMENIVIFKTFVVTAILKMQLNSHFIQKV